METWPLRQWVFDAYQTLSPRTHDSNPLVLLVAIDDKAIAAHGRWPWPRSLLAQLLDRIVAAAPAAVGVDMLLSEADSISGSRIAALYPQLPSVQREALNALPNGDAALAAAIRGKPVVLGALATGTSTSCGSLKLRDNWAGGQIQLADDAFVGALPCFSDKVVPIPTLAEASGHALLNAFEDADGVTRRMPLLARIGDAVVPGLALSVIATAHGKAPVVVALRAEGVSGISIGNNFIRTRADGAIPLHFSHPNPARIISAADLLAEDATVELRGKIVLVGVLASGGYDVIATPVAPRVPGVEVQAQVIENALAGTPLLRPRIALPLELLATVLICGTVLIAIPLLGTGGHWIVGIGSVVVTLLAGLVLFVWQNILLDPTFPIAAGATVDWLLLTGVLTRTSADRQALAEALRHEREAALRIAGELRAAREIQRGMLPDLDLLDDLPVTLRLHGVLRPAREVGGDLYDAFMLDEHRLCLLVGDVCGKGIPAALFMALCKTLAKSVALSHPNASAGELLALLSRELDRDNPVAMFVTAALCILDARTGAYQLALAGHEPPLRLRDSIVSDLKLEGGPPLCVLDEFDYPTNAGQLEVREMLIMMTDGITEATALDGAFFGQQGVRSTLAMPGATPADVTANMTSAVAAFTRGAEASDDLVILCAQFRG